MCFICGAVPGWPKLPFLLNHFNMWQLPKGFHSWDEFNIVIIEAFIIAALVLIGIIKHTNKDK